MSFQEMMRLQGGPNCMPTGTGPQPFYSIRQLDSAVKVPTNYTKVTLLFRFMLVSLKDGKHCAMPLGRSNHIGLVIKHACAQFEMLSFINLVLLQRNFNKIKMATGGHLNFDNDHRQSMNKMTLVWRKSSVKRNGSEVIASCFSLIPFYVWENEGW
jgi:hypothetical protein